MRNHVLLPILLCLPVLLLVNAAESNPQEKTQRATTAKVQVVDQKVVTAVSGVVKDAVKPKQARKILIFSRTMGYRHRSIPLGQRVLSYLGSESGAYEVTISDSLDNFEKPAIDTFDAICFLNTTLNVFGSAVKPANEEAMADAKARERRLKQNFAEYVAGGKGFIGIHAATDTFYEWEEFGSLIGGYFDNHPWLSSTDVVIDVEQGMEKHPLNTGFKTGKLSFKEEIYQFKSPYDSKKLNILTRLNTRESNMDVRGIKRKDNDFGVSWYKDYGKGRVFYCSLGHNDHIYYNPEVLAHYLAGIQYALGDLEIAEKK